MNFLAHLFLSFQHDEVMIGNFIGDFIRGSGEGTYSADIVAGIRLHRKIDQFTDSHPVVRRSTQRLSPEFGRYAGVITDVFYDHFLAVEWRRYSPLPLPEFANYAYQVCDRYHHVLPESVQTFLPFMIRQNWLINYGTLYGMERSLAGLSRRATFMKNFERALDNLQLHYELYRNDFTDFFPDIVTMSQLFITERSS